MRINNNIAALNTYRQLTVNSTNTAKSLEKLSSGLRINRAGDDAAGLAISEKMRAQIRGLDQASRNSQDAISLIQTAEGAMSETHSILQRMRELAVQSANDTNQSADRETIQKEINQLTSEINRIGNTTEFNTKKLLNGERADTFVVTGTSFSGGATGVTLLGASGTLTGALSSGSYSVTVSKTVSGTTVNTTVIDTSGLNSSGGSLTGTLADVVYSGASTHPVFNGNAITITSGAGKMVANATVSGKITITRLSGNAIQVDVSNNSGVNLIDDIVVNASGKFVYDNGGVSFTIDAATGWDSGAGNKIEYVFGSGLATATVGTEQKYFTAADQGAKTAISSVSLVSGASNGLVDGDYSITFAKKTGGALYVHVSGSNGSGQIVNDTYSGIMTANFTYSGFGIKFSVSGANFADSGLSGTFQFRVDNEVSHVSGDTTYVTTYSAQLTDSGGANVGTATTLGVSAAAANSGAAIAGGFSGVIGGGLQLKFVSGTSPLSGTVNFTVDRTTSGADNSLAFQIGANEHQSLSLSVADVRSQALGISAGAIGSGYRASQEVTDGTNSSNVEFALDVTTTASAASAVTILDEAINKVSTERSKLGAVQNRLEHTINNLGTSSENLTAAESRIRDVDMAKQMMDFTKNNILTQAAQAMLAQANQQPQGVLQLLR